MRDLRKMKGQPVQAAGRGSAFGGADGNVIALHPAAGQALDAKTAFITNTLAATGSFVSHRDAAIAVLIKATSANRYVTRFLGEASALPALSEKQDAWLRKLLVQNDLPPLAREA